MTTTPTTRKVTEGRTLEPSTGGQARVVLDATGSPLGIMPWNFPVLPGGSFCAPNLMLGNTILLKHAGNVPQSAVVQEELFHEAGFLSRMFTSTSASSDQIADTIPDPAVQGVSLTGSERAGSSVGRHRGKHLKKVVLELGGSEFVHCPGRREPGAHREARGQGTHVQQRPGLHQLQARFIALEDAYESFVEKFSQAVQGIEAGDPRTRKLSWARSAPWVPVTRSWSRSRCHRQGCLRTGRR